MCNILAHVGVHHTSFGSVPEWTCHSDDELLTLFNAKFPLPHQASWTVFHLDTKVTTRVISALRMKGTTLDEWQQLPTIGKYTGPIGQNMSDLWDWTLTYRGLSSRSKSASSRDSPRECARDTMEGESAL